ncbi:MAG: ParB N-terminal domain-containing protein, partial [Terriglobales bacterium]
MISTAKSQRGGIAVFFGAVQLDLLVYIPTDQDIFIPENASTARKVYIPYGLFAMNEMKSPTQKKIHAYFERKATAIFWPGDLPKILRDLREECNALDLNAEQILKFLLEEEVLCKAEFRSPTYPPIVRYLWGHPSSYQLAISLRRNSFLCHRTALVLHGLEQPSKLIYVNQEQTPKSPSEGVTQEAITSAFANHQRQSKYLFKYVGAQYLLLSGKNTGRTGVVQMKGPDGKDVDVTDLERTLIDVVVRPAYAGGINQVAQAYKQAAHNLRKTDLDKGIDQLAASIYAHGLLQSLVARKDKPGKYAVAARRRRLLALESLAES